MQWIINMKVAGLIYSYGPEADLEEYIVYSKVQSLGGSNYLCRESDVAKM